MNRSINARIQGDDYQRLFFWFCALKMFNPNTCVEKVAYESNFVPGFDDVIVYYKKDNPYFDRWHNPVSVDFFQVKFHVTNEGSFKLDDLMDPAFIGATTSIMERLRDAHEKCSQNGIQARFNFLSPWYIHPDDDLSKIIANYEYEMRIHQLFDTNTKPFPEIKQKMKDYLELSNDNELKEILKPFRIWHGFGSFQQLKENININLSALGFKPIEDNTILNPYIELIKNWSLQEITEFDKDFIIDECKRENLYLRDNPIDSDYKDVGIRSFYEGAENMQDETVEICSLIDFFDDRYIKDNSYWNKEIFNELYKFREKIDSNNKYKLYMDTHLSISFVAGYLFNHTTGIEIYPMQKTMRGKEFWYPEKCSSTVYKMWEVTEIPKSGKIKDVALVIEISLPILNEVEKYVADQQIEVSKIIRCNLGDDIGSDSIIDGTHALKLATNLSTILKERRDTQEKANRLHIFAACPVGFIFYLGKVSRFFGKIILYEHDKKCISGGHYLPSFELFKA